jgi:transcriptional regulator with XRE-family HTH domain
MTRLQELRESRGWTKAELARRARLNPSTVGAIEGGRLQPYPRQLIKLAKALGVGKTHAAGLTENLEVEP